MNLIRVGIDVGPLAGTRTGVGAYCYNLLRHALLQQSACTLTGLSVALAPPDLGGLSEAFPYKRIPIPTRLIYGLWSTLGRPKIESILGELDVYHSTNYVVPPTRRARRIVTIHDLAFLAVPELCSPKIVGPFSREVPRFCQEADAIIADSEFTQSEIVRLIGVDPDTITAIPLAAGEGFVPMDPDEARSRLSARYHIEDPFLLFVGTLEPRKNVTGLLRAFDLLKREIPHKLVLIGAEGWGLKPILACIEELDLADRIIRPGYVPDADLPAFYCAASVFVFPTLYEGFGLPLLEAMGCGCPVVTSDSASVPEVCGDAALCTDATDFEGIAGLVLNVLSDADLRQGLIKKGLAQGARFTWEDTARKTLRLYESVAAC